MASSTPLLRCTSARVSAVSSEQRIAEAQPSSDKKAKKLRDALDPYVSAGRRISGGRPLYDFGVIATPDMSWSA
jgi:hypothetical protein